MIYKRASKIRPVKIVEMRVHETCQRKERPGWVRYLLEKWDFNEFGYPVVNFRDGNYFIIDGQHRVATLKVAGFGDESVDCVVYENLSDEEMAEMFLRLNDRKSVATFDKFMVGVEANRPEESAVMRMVLANKLKIGRSATKGTIAAVHSLMKAHRYGDVVLAQTLRTLRDAYEAAPEGFDGIILEGLAMVFNRFNGRTDEARMVEALGDIKSGPVGLRRRAELIREKLDADLRHCIAAATVEAYNRKAARGDKLDSWWKANED
jgi:hypothetical protein